MSTWPRFKNSLIARSFSGNSLGRGRGLPIQVSVSRRSGTSFLFVTIEIEIAGDFVGKSCFVIDKAFEMDSRYASIGQQDPKRWFSCTGFIFRDPGRLNGMLRT